MRNRLAALIMMVCACLTAQTAFADDCPEGTVGFINTETYEKVCLPQNTNSATTAGTDVNTTVKDIAADVKAVESQTTPSSPDTTAPTATDTTAPSATDTTTPTATDTTLGPTAAEARAQQPAEVAQPPVIQGGVQTVLPNVEESVQTLPYYETKAERIAKINASMKAPGVLMKLGVGYGLFLNAEIKALVGYKFGAEGAAAFGLYLDLNMRPGVMPVYSMDVTVAPTVHAMAGRFMFSFSIGLGAFIELGKMGYYYDDEDDCCGDEDNTISKNGYFELKPAMVFDFFLTNHALFGFGFDVPVYILTGDDSGATASFSVDIHVGYKF